MDEEILFIRQLDLPIFSELAEVLNEENGWSVLLRFLPKNALGSFDLNKIKKSFAFCKNPSLELLTNLNITVQQLMHCLTEANLFKALEVIKEDEPLLILQDVPEEVILSSGGKLYLTCDVVGFPPPCCQWFHGKTLLPNQNSNHLCIDQISVENSGLYTCRIHKPNRKKGNMDFLFTRWCKVIVEDQHTTESDKYETDNEDISPYICQQPSVVMVLKGENCEISCTAYAIPPPSFHWYKDGNPTENRKSTLMIKNAKSFDQGTYKCKVSNKLGSVWTEAASVEIGLKILKHPAHQSDRYVEYGTSILLECVARSNCQIIYTWYKGPEAIPDSNCSSLKLTNDNKGNDVKIWYVGCVAADGVESAMSKQVVVKFLPKNEITSFTAEDKIALLIANQRYDHLCDLKSAISDAHTMAKILEEMEFKVITVCDLNLLEIKNIVNLFCQMLSTGVYGVFYYAGHGFQLQGQCFILPVDVSESYCTAECFNIEDLVDMMQLHNPGLACIFLDTCLKTPDEAVPASQEFLKPRDTIKQQNLIYSYSTAWSGHSYEERNSHNGFFVRHLKKHIKKDESIWDVLMAVNNEFKKDPKASKMQNPWTAGNLSKQLSLSDNITGYGPEFEARTARWKKLTALPDDQIILFDGLDICIEVIFEKGMDIFCNFLQMTLQMKRIAGEEKSSFAQDLKDLRVVPNFLSNVFLSIDEDERPFLKIIKMCLYDLQRLEHPLDCEVQIVDATNFQILAMKQICLGEPMIAKAMLWKNIFLG